MKAKLEFDLNDPDPRGHDIYNEDKILYKVKGRLTKAKTEEMIHYLQSRGDQ